jgi:hypothetical protein
MSPSLIGLSAVAWALLAPGHSQASLPAPGREQGAYPIRPPERVRVAALDPQARGAPSRPGSARILVDGQEIPSDVPPVIVAGTVLVPLRFIGEALGATVTWEPEQKLATVQAPRRTVAARIGDATVRAGSGAGDVTARAYTAEAPPRIIAGRTMLPLRVVGLALGASVDWDARTRTVLIRTDGTSAAGTSSP